jgi:hypothetical protein
MNQSNFYPWENIEQNPWGSNWKHLSRFRLGVSNGSKALKVDFYCEESQVLSNHFQHQSAVFNDSCVEFFFRIQEDDNYFNFECNHLGFLLAAYGPNRSNRFPLDVLDLKSIVTQKSLVSKPNIDCWNITLEIPLTLLNKISKLPYHFESNWYGNFQRCGGIDKNFYACWAPILTDKPDFHRPEFFRPLTIHFSKES